MRMLALVCWNDLPPVYQEQEQGLLILLTLLVDHAFHPKMLLVMFNFLSLTLHWRDTRNKFQEICKKSNRTFRRCTDTFRDSFSSNSDSRKAFLSIVAFIRASKSSSEASVLLQRRNNYYSYRII